MIRSTTPAVLVEGLVKRYPRREVPAVAGLSFRIAEGEVFGLLGPNGAGKSTTIGAITTRVVPTSGEIRIAGVDVRARPVEARRVLGVVPQHNNLDRAISIEQNLLFHARYHRLPAARRGELARQLLTEFGLAGHAGERPQRLSGGQAQRVKIARALMHDPAVLVLDEPSTGLDPAARQFIWQRVRELRARGVTVLLTTHDMVEAAELADRVGIIDHGRLIAMDTPAALTSTVTDDTVLEVAGTPGPGFGQAELAELRQAAAGLGGVREVEQAELRPEHQRLRLRLIADTGTPGLLSTVDTLLAARGVALADVHVGKPTLEDVFLRLTGRSLR
ncbi:ABC transporter ATP-binding protein [Crossiella sp. CA-258035]|uniref:ABC transporter ATP-binding protein n=1 Tax=Crossiella sp. CA-258035 TaxID=2981138 RepID=UPI0024BC1419|nr:ABC transporter ATP-binding protein [Crossiella sp. CA-258035]WHT16240.1 ABC transporter ATP-binding protein [Crossiella sp. CA-258035]